MEYLSIKEFAQRAGVSTQAIYQRLDKDLKRYCKEVDGRKKLDISALKMFETTIQKKEVDDGLVSVVKALQSTLEVLTAQLEAKDRQIEELNKRLAEANQLNQNNQVLISRQQEQKQIEESVAEATQKRSFWSFRKR